MLMKTGSEATVRRREMLQEVSAKQGGMCLVQTLNASLVVQDPELKQFT